MKNRNILLLLLGLAMIQNQTSAASKHYLVESKGKQYLIKTEGKAEKGRGGEQPLGEKLPDGLEVKDDKGDIYKLTGAIELYRLILEDYDLEKRKDEITNTLIDSTCTISDSDYYNNFTEVTPLLLACYMGNSKAALLLLSKGANPNKEAKSFNDFVVEVFTPLYHAVLHGSTEVVRRLLEKGADPNKEMRALNKDGDMILKTPLYVAANAANVNAEIVRSLLKRGADPNKGQRISHKNGDVYVETPLYMATLHGYTEVVKSLLESKARQDLDTEGNPLEVAKNQYEDSKNYEDEGEDGMIPSSEYNEIIKLLEAAQSG